MSTTPSPAHRVRIRGSGFDIAEADRGCGASLGNPRKYRTLIGPADRFSRREKGSASGTARAIYDVTCDATGACIAEVEVGTMRGRRSATVRLIVPRRAAGLRLLAAPLARLLDRIARAPMRMTIRDRRDRTLASLPAATRSTLARAFARCGGRNTPATSASARGALEHYGEARGMARTREPTLLAFAGIDIHGREQWLEANAGAAWRRLQRAAASDGVTLQLVSAFRSITYQSAIVARKLARGQSLDEILRVNAAPGYSEHHGGRALDLTTPGFPALEEAFEQSPAFAWLRANAHRFGFTLSYPRDNPHGIAYEPWHWRFDAATARAVA